MKEKDKEELLEAISTGDTKTVEKFLLGGLETESAPFDSGKWLHFAAMHRSVPVIQRLLNAGADPNSCDLGGASPLHEAVKSHPKPVSGDVSAAEVVKVLIDGGADPNAQNADGITPLMAAFMSFNISTELVEVLLRLGANPGVEDKQGNSVSYYASFGNPDDPEFIDRQKLLTQYRTSSRAYSASIEQSEPEDETREFFGLTTEDLNEEALLIKADISQVLEKLKKLLRPQEIVLDAVGKEIPSNDLRWVIYCLKRSSWTIIQSLDSETSPKKLLPQIVQISKGLGVSAIHVVVSDTAYSSAYKLFDKGELKEEQEFGEEDSPMARVDEFLREHSAILPGWSNSARTMTSGGDRSRVLCPPSNNLVDHLHAIRV